MAYEQRDNSGSVFVNDKKESDKHPDRTGSAMIDGKHYWVSGWIKKSAGGKQFLSLAFKPKEEKADKPAREEPRETRHEDLDDEIPF